VAEKEETKTKETKTTGAQATDGNSGFNPSEFWQGTREELGKIVWPTRQQLVSESVAVLLMVVVSATLIYLVDNLFTWASNQVF